MLALRLSGARSIRAQPSGQPCCAHVTRAGVNGRSRPTCVTTIGQRRNYANSDSKNDAPAPSNNPGPDAKNKAATDPSKKGPRPDLDAMVLIRNALTLLRRFKENPKEFGQGAEQNYDLRQNRIFTGTLKVLKDALQVHAAATTKLGQGAQDLNAAGTLKDAYDVVQSLAPKEVKDSPKAPIKSAKSAKSAGAAPKADKAQVQPVKTPEKKAASVKQKPTSPAKQPTKQIPAETSVAKSMKKVGATAKVRMEEAQSNKTESKATDGAKSKAQKSQSEQTLERQQEDTSAQKDSKKASDPVAEAVTASLASVVLFRRAKPAVSPPKPPKIKGKHEIRPAAAQDAPRTKDSTENEERPTIDDIREAPTFQQLVEDEKRFTIEPEKPKVEKYLKSKGVPKKEEEPKQSPRSRKAKKHVLKVETFRADPASALVPIAETISVPLIQYGLDRVLFKEGVYPLQDPRTRVYNFDPYLASIMPISQFDFDALTQYITSSKDQKLIGITRDQKKKYTGSTSSMTSVLAHFHFLLSQWRPINPARLTHAFDFEQDSFSGISKAPAAVFLNYKDGVYAIDADKEWDDETILSMLGKSMEKLMTVPKEDFERYHRDRSHELTDEERGQEESYHYTTYGDFVMRSQLDAYDPRLPGTGVYDLKTRAVVSIRADAAHPEKGAGYEIRQRDGNWESFEREYADLIRSAFLKYSLQVRMGRMDGIFVAYHNTERIFGFQYIPLEEMDLSLHGTMDKTLGDMEFTASLKMLNDLINRATAKFPEQSLRIFVEARQSEAEQPVHFLYFFAEPVTDEEIKQVQERKKGAIEKFRKKFGLARGGEEDAEVEPAIEEATPVAAEEPETPAWVEAEVKGDDSADIWEDMMEVVEDTMNKDAEGITAIRDAIKEALEQSGLLRAKSSEEAERYVEALLKSVVATGSAPVEAEQVPEAQASEETTNVEPEAPEPVAPKKSGFGSLFSWFGSNPKEPENSAKEPPQESQETIKEETAPALDPDTKDIPKDTAKGEADNRPSPELVELLLKLTSRVEMTTNKVKQSAGKAEQQELSDDQASIQSFQRILSELIPEAVESTKSEAKAVEPETPGTSSDSAAADTAEKEMPKEVFGMVVSVRSKVNTHPVVRPSNLKRNDKWVIDYAVEELESEKVQKLYLSCKNRRMRTLSKHDKQSWKQDPHMKNIIERTLAGRAFRKQENAITQGKPVWIVGQHKPLPAEEVWTGAGVKLEHVLPSLDVPRPVAGEFPTEIEYSAPLSQQPTHASMENFFKERYQALQQDSSKATLQGPQSIPKRWADPTSFKKLAFDNASGRQTPVETAGKSSKGPDVSAGAIPFGKPALESPWSGQAPVEPVEERSKGSDVSKDETSRLNSWLQLAEDNAADHASENAGKKDAGKKDAGKKDAGKEDTIAQSVAELRKSEQTKASSFKEWREKSKQK